MNKVPFSVQLETWLKSKGSKTIAGLDEIFAEKSFALAFLLLLAIPALPLPTGGITHVFEVIAMLLALELIIGRSTIWLPKRWQKTEIGHRTRKKILPFLMRRIRWFEKYSRRRAGGIIGKTWFRSVMGLIVLVFSLAAFLAPPFSGLDTLPALGVVVLSLGLILEDIIIVIVGIVIGVTGIAVTIGLSTIIVTFIHNLLH